MRSLGADEIEVVYQGVAPNGKMKLSRKAALEAKYDKKRSGQSNSKSPPPAAMSEDELDVIAKAIEGIHE